MIRYIIRVIMNILRKIRIINGISYFDTIACNQNFLQDHHFWFKLKMKCA